MEQTVGKFEATPEKVTFHFKRPATPGDLASGRYGPFGEGSEVQDTQAYHDACQEVFDAGGGVIKVPPGLFRITQPFSTTQDIGKADTNGIALEGVTQHCSVFETENGLFDWTLLSQRDVAAEFRNFGVHMASEWNNGTIINVTQPAGGLAFSSRCIAEKLRIRPADAVFGTAYCTKAIDFSSTYFPRIQSCSILQARQGDWQAPHGINLANIQKGTLINVNDCYGAKVFDNQLWGGEIGISNVITQNPGGEGGRFIGNELVLSKTGALIDGNIGREPAVTFSGNHTNCTEYGALFRRKRLLIVDKNVCYNQGTAAYTDLMFENCDASQVMFNQFHFGGNPNRTHICADANSSNMNRVGNWHASDGTALDITSGATEVHSALNTFNHEIDTELSDPSGVNDAVSYS